MSLRLTIDGSIYRCLPRNEIQSCCTTLRRLHIRINQSCFLEDLVEHVPNLEQLSVVFEFSLRPCLLWKSNVELLRISKKTWFDRVRILSFDWAKQWKAFLAPELAMFQFKNFSWRRFGICLFEMASEQIELCKKTSTSSEKLFIWWKKMSRNLAIIHWRKFHLAILFTWYNT